MIDEARLSEVISEGVNLRAVEPHIYSLYSTAENANSYDKIFGALYDLVACSRLYNRLIWGYSTADYHSWCLDALGSSKDGWVLDAGCGSLAFTAKTYVRHSEHPIVFLDQSIKLLGLAKSRVVQLNGKVPSNMVFLHGDVRRLPFKPESFRTVISLNLLHVFKDEDVKKVLQELKNVLSDGGTIFLTTLIENSRWADKYLHMWARAGEVVPRNANQLFEVFNALGIPIKYRIRGNLAFIHCG